MNNNQQQPSGGGGTQNEDYLDKGLDYAEQKFGQGKIDPSKMRSTNEKITDTMRGAFQNLTGKEVPKNVSN